MDKRIKNIWSKEQDDFLKENYVSMTRKKMAIKLNRTLDSINKRMDRYLKLNKDSAIRIAMVGKKVGWLTIVSYVETRKKRSFYSCVCKCGKQKLVEYNTLKNNRIVSCGCHKLQHLERTQYRMRFKMYKYAAKKRHFKFQLTFKQFKVFISQNCYYCGSNPVAIPLLSIYKKNNISVDRAIVINGIDRKDNKIGYVLQNCVPCCTLCNDMKHALEMNTFLSHVKKIEKYQNNHD